jgi:TIR domain
MAKLFVSYAHADREPVSNIAQGLEMAGHEVWWDRRIRANQDFGMEIEAALHGAKCAVVAWSSSARNSLWVRAEATAAWESSKLVQLSLDGARPPLPFTMIHLLDFSTWYGRADDLSWVSLEQAIEGVLKGGVSVRIGQKAAKVRLGGFGSVAAIGAASLALILIAAGLVVVGVSGFFSANFFGIISFGMLLVAMLGFTHMVTQVIKTYVASR